MADRIYDRSLDCGCSISSDGGGGLMPCFYLEPSKDELQKHNKAWKDWKKSDDYKLHCKEVKERNE